MIVGVFQESALEDVKLPTTLKRIEHSAFIGCKSLKKIKLPEGLEYIGKTCFAESCLRKVQPPSSLKVADCAAFKDCE